MAQVSPPGTCLPSLSRCPLEGREGHHRLRPWAGIKPSHRFGRCRPAAANCLGSRWSHTRNPRAHFALILQKSLIVSVEFQVEISLQHARDVFHGLPTGVDSAEKSGNASRRCPCAVCLVPGRGERVLRRPWSGSDDDPSGCVFLSVHSSWGPWVFPHVWVYSFPQI